MSKKRRHKIQNLNDNNYLELNQTKLEENYQEIFLQHMQDSSWVSDKKHELELEPEKINKTIIIHFILTFMVLL